VFDPWPNSFQLSSKAGPRRRVAGTCRAVGVQRGAGTARPSNELGHLPAGNLAIGHFAMFELYRVNPPLGADGGHGALALGSSRRPIGATTSSTRCRARRSRWAFASPRRTARGPSSCFTVARWACIPFSLLGGLDLLPLGARFNGGGAAGWLAMLLWCFNPFVLGFGALVKPDVAGRGGGRVGCLPVLEVAWPADLARAAVAGLALGLAELTKFTLLVFPADLAGRMAGEALGGHRISNGRHVERNSFRLPRRKPGESWPSRLN